jgi:methylglyoxal synthase
MIRTRQEVDARMQILKDKHNEFISTYNNFINNYQKYITATRASQILNNTNINVNTKTVTVPTL